MHRRLVSGLQLVLITAVASACGEPEVSNLTYAEVRDAAQGKDAAAYRSYFKDLKGKRVAWSGRVVEVRTEHGDEFAEIGALLLDLDGVAPEADAVLQVSVATAEDMAPGRTVKFTGTLQDVEWTNQRPLLRLEAKEIE
jgi:hypothetical protein